MSEHEKNGSIYHFVQNDIAFGYNESDKIKASKVMKDGYGQCNTKGTLFMALLRSVGIPCRFNGFTIDKKLQKGAITGLSYLLAPRNIIHSWVEVYYQEKWLNLEGFILDKKDLINLHVDFRILPALFVDTVSLFQISGIRKLTGKERTPISKKTESIMILAFLMIRILSTESMGLT